MKILFVSNTTPPRVFGGYELYLGRVMAALEDSGWTVGALSSVRSPGGEPLAWHNRHLSPLSPKQLERRERADQQTTERALRAIAPDLISIWNLGGLANSVFDTLTESGTPYTIHVGDLWPVHNLQRGDPRFENVHYISAYVRTACEDAGLHPHRVTVSHWGTDGVAPPDDGPMQKVLFAGRICRQKGLLTAVRALAQTQDLTLTVAGAVEDKKYLQEIKTTIARKDMDTRVRFVGMVPSETMPALLADHGIVVYPSETAEPFGLGIIEAMAAGRVVVASPVGGIAELIEHDENGLTFQPGDAQGLAARFKQIQADRSAADRLAASGRRTAAERFSFARSVEDIRTFIQRVIQEPIDAKAIV